MTALAELLRPAEAAVVAAVELRDVNRAIDEHILSKDFISLDNGRRVHAAACTLIAFYFDSARRLTSEERIQAIRESEARILAVEWETWASNLLGDWTVRHDFLTIDLAPFVRRTGERLGDLIAARAMVVSDPTILDGTPVIEGTRVPVHDVAAALAADASMERVREAYPSLGEREIRLSALYAEANPQRGRPRTPVSLPEGSVIVTDRRVSRHRAAR